MTLQDILTVFTLVAGVVAVFELLEYIFTRNIPWLARLVAYLWRRLRRGLGWEKIPPGQRYLLLNFSAHPILPGQEQVIKARLGWPKIEVIEARLGNLPEDRDFTPEALHYIERIELLPAEWQTTPLVVAPPGYAPAWGVLLAELHGRLGYFPDMVRLRPAPAHSREKFEVVEIISLREVRSRARAKR